MSHDPYEVLGVADGVTPADLKKAYYRKIKQHPPETHPEQFKVVQRAYEAASDPGYPAMRKHGAEINALMGEVSDLMAAKDWPEAIKRLKRVVVLHPGLAAAWNQLGVCHIRAGNWDDAKKTFARLVKQVADSVLYWSNYAQVYIQEADGMERNPPVEARLAREARERLAEARRLAPDDPEVCEAYAQSYSAEADWKGAVEWAEKATAAGGDPDANRYVFLARMLYYGGRGGEILLAADRLLARLPDAAARTFAAGRFALFAIEVFKGHHFAMAQRFVDAAARIDPANETVRDLKTGWDNAAAASAEYDRMGEDAGVIPPVRLMLAVYTDEARGLELSEPREDIFKRIKEALDTWSAEDLASSARRVRTHYPKMYGLNTEVFDDFEKLAPAAAVGGQPKNLFDRVASWFS